MKTHLWISLACVGLSAAVLGCSGGEEGPETYHLQGEATYDGKPIPQGTITFSPDGTKGNKGPQGRAKIVDGKYNTAEEGGSGVVGGPHEVIISGFDGNADPAAELPMGKPLFQEYRTNKDLPPVSEGTDEPMKMDFQVPKK